MTRDREDARDLVGDTVLSALEHFDELSDPKAFLSWIFTIARRIATRKRKRGGLFGPYDESSALNIRDHSIAPDDAADLHMLYEALSKLPQAQREAVTMFEISGLSLEEIREVQGGSLSGVKSRLSRGREKLAELLGVEDTQRVPQSTNGIAAPLVAPTSVRSTHA